MRYVDGMVNSDFILSLSLLVALSLVYSRGVLLCRRIERGTVFIGVSQDYCAFFYLVIWNSLLEDALQYTFKRHTKWLQVLSNGIFTSSTFSMFSLCTLGWSAKEIHSDCRSVPGDHSSSTSALYTLTTCS